MDSGRRVCFPRRSDAGVQFRYALGRPKDGHGDIIGQLLIDDAGAALAARDTRNPDVIVALLKAGADGTLASDAGKTAFDYAAGNPKLKGTAAYKALNKARLPPPAPAAPAAKPAPAPPKPNN